MYKVLLKTCFILLLMFHTEAKIRNNVCKNYLDYYFKRWSKNCRYNPDAYDNLETIVKRYGYPVETYYVTTSDGYILRMFRIPHGRSNTTNAPNKTPLFMIHAYGGNSVLWLSANEQSFAFQFADAGFDVWMLNNRGTYYSKEHANKTFRSSEKYWDYSMTEASIYDVPAGLDLVNKITGKAGEIVYIGYSAGGIISWVYGSMLPEHSVKMLKAMIIFGTSGSFKHFQAPIRIVLPLVRLLKPIVMTIMQATKQVKHIQHGSLQMLLSNILVWTTPLNFKIFIFILSIVVGIGDLWKNYDMEIMPVFINQLEFPGSSLKTPYHYIQQAMSKELQQYDYGSYLNRLYYNSTKPPLFPLEKIQVPIHTLVGTGDGIGTVEEIKYLYSRIGGNAKKYGYHIVPQNKFSHEDFLTSKHAKELVIEYIINFIRFKLK